MYGSDHHKPYLKCTAARGNDAPNNYSIVLRMLFFFPPACSPARPDLCCAPRWLERASALPGNISIYRRPWRAWRGRRGGGQWQHIQRHLRHRCGVLSPLIHSHSTNTDKNTHTHGAYIVFLSGWRQHAPAPLRTHEGDCQLDGCFVSVSVVYAPGVGAQTIAAV